MCVSRWFIVNIQITITRSGGAAGIFLYPGLYLMLLNIPPFYHYTTLYVCVRVFFIVRSLVPVHIHTR